jgi:hypothetical protein
MILTPETRDALNGQWSDDLVGTGRKTPSLNGMNLIEYGVERHKKAKERIPLGPLRTDRSKR